MFKIFVQASVVGTALLGGVYMILVTLGWRYNALLQGVPPQEMLGQVALTPLGSMAAPCLVVAIVFACLTTAIILASLFAEFIQKEIFPSKGHYPAALVLTLLIGFGVSSLEFGGIARLLGPILETAYPALVVLTLVNLVRKRGVVLSNSLET